ncbi:MAG: DUF4399 domain-containing protein [Woeseiaceae bacterium]
MPVTRFTAAVLILAMSVTACSRQPAENPIGERPVDEDPVDTTDKAPASASTASDVGGLVRIPSPGGARVFFITPADGDTVSNPITIEFGIQGMNVVKAGDDQADSGHHHLLIDTELPDLELPIPASPNHVHFGDGSTSTQITLEPGTHTLCLLLGDHRHIPHDPAIASDAITIKVE